MTSESQKEATTGPRHFKDKYGRAWETHAVWPIRAQCVGLRCPHLAAVDIRKVSTSLGRRELRCWQHWQEYAAVMGMVEVAKECLEGEL